MTAGPVKAEEGLPAEVVMVEDAVNNVVVMAVEVATMEAMVEGISTAEEPMALMTGALVVFVVLQDLVLIKGIWMEAYETPATNALLVTNECLVPWLVKMIEMMLLLVVVPLTLDVMHPSAVRMEHALTEWQVTIMDVEMRNDVVRVEVVMVVNAVSNDVVMLVEEANLDAAMDEDVSTPVEPTALMTGSLVVFVVLQESVLIKGVQMEVYATPASNACT